MVGGSPVHTGELLMAIVLDNQNNKIYVNGTEIANSGGLVSTSMQVTPHGTITSTNLQGALEQLADQDFRSNSEPTSNVEVGDTWYKIDTAQLKIYRETSTGVFEWVPIMIGNISNDSDTVDAGGF
jgi:hypothetical protein